MSLPILRRVMPLDVVASNRIEQPCQDAARWSVPRGAHATCAARASRPSFQTVESSQPRTDMVLAAHRPRPPLRCPPLARLRHSRHLRLPRASYPGMYGELRRQSLRPRKWFPHNLPSPSLYLLNPSLRPNHSLWPNHNQIESHRRCRRKRLKYQTREQRHRLLEFQQIWRSQSFNHDRRPCRQ